MYEQYVFPILDAAFVMLFAVFCVLMFVAIIGAVFNLRVLLGMDEDEDQDEIQRRDRRS